jgi:hypothetical protein
MGVNRLKFSCDRSVFACTLAAAFLKPGSMDWLYFVPPLAVFRAEAAYQLSAATAPVLSSPASEVDTFSVFFC